MRETPSSAPLEFGADRGIPGEGLLVWHVDERVRGFRTAQSRPEHKLLHLVGIPVTNTSVNPARSTAPALFVGGWALAQLWLFWLAPIVGAAAAGATGRWLGAADGK